jgi:hypothetical protein
MLAVELLEMFRALIVQLLQTSSYPVAALLALDSLLMLRLLWLVLLEMATQSQALSLGGILAFLPEQEALPPEFRLPQGLPLVLLEFFVLALAVVVASISQAKMVALAVLAVGPLVAVAVAVLLTTASTLALAV